MKKRIVQFFATLFIYSSFIFNTSAQNEIKPVDYVDPFIGVDGDGNIFPGASLPFGMVKLGPDMTKEHSYLNPNGGFMSGQKLYGFSHTHLSGSGGGGKYGNIRVVPTIDGLNKFDYRTDMTEEEATPGIFKAYLPDHDIRVNLTCSHSVGFHEYFFPKSDQSTLMFDLGAMILSGSSFQYLVNSEVEILSDTEITGWSKVGGGWNYGKPYTVYFYAISDTPAEQLGTWKQRRIEFGSKSEKLNRGGEDGFMEKNVPSGAFFIYRTEKGQSIKLKVGISYISIAKAKENLYREIPDWNFLETFQNARMNWNTLLEKVKIPEGYDSQKKTFYTALYHSLLMPTNRTGENPTGDNKTYYDDFYALWDTYRTTNPLLTLLYPDKQEEIVNALINIGAAEGYMPDARSGNYTGLTQGGSNSDILIADAMVKGLQNIDYKNGYKLMVKNAEVEPDDFMKWGRGGINAFKEFGYLPNDVGWSCSRTIDYSICDFALYTVAKELGYDEDMLKYEKRANNWQKLWRPVNEGGIEGFIWPKDRYGDWITNFSTRQWGAYFYEGYSWEYSLCIPHDVASVIELSGGKEAFVARLDTFFNKGYFQLCNEPGFLTPCLYNWAGRPDRTAERIDSLRLFYTNARNGIPGNDDAGAMSSWFVFHALGIYPNTGHDYYLVSTPMFPVVELLFDSGKTLKILAKNISDKNIYIRSARLNGKKLTRSWIKHSEICNGGVLEFNMGNKPSAWGRKELPPSMSKK